MSIEGLHVWCINRILMHDRFGLDNIKQNGTYQDIIDRHMSKIWSEL